MAKLAKLLQAAAGAGTAGGLNVEEMFSTNLVELTASTSYGAVTNNIDLSGEGGLVWEKARNITQVHRLYDTERGANKILKSDSTAAEVTATTTLTSFNSDGFTLDYSFYGSNTSECFWTFRKAPKFFDVVTYTGNSTAGRTVSHNLGAVPAVMIVKCTSTTGQWITYHHSTSANPQNEFLMLNSTSAKLSSPSVWNSTAPTSTDFTLSDNGAVNGNGNTYVAYLFAHNDGDGDFGPTGDQDIIKCGSFTGAGYSESEEFNVNLGFEPQWIMYKRTDSSTGGGWFMVDNMRGWRPETSSNFEYLQAQSSNAEAQSGALGIRSDGFRVREGLGRQYIYIAIRRGPMAVPESATDVFDMDFLGATSPNPPAYNSSGWPVDMGIQGAVGALNSNATSARLIQGKFLVTDDANAETTSSQYAFDFQDGWRDSTAVSNDYLGYMWRRAPNYFDVVCYTGNGTAGRTVSHNLGVAPEMMWVKGRSIGQNWAVYNPNGRLQLLNQTGAEYSAAVTDDYFGNGSSVIAPTETEFTLGTASPVNSSGSTYIAYLFASLDGVSKVGSYTGTGAAGNQIDCGFSSGARFVLIKSASAGGHWAVYDTERGIVAGNDSKLRLNNTNAAITNVDSIDPYNSGFELADSSGDTNTSGVTYIFYAIA